MSTEQTKTRLSEFTYAGIAVPSLIKEGPLYGYLEKPGKIYKLVSHSGPLAWKIAYKSVGRDQREKIFKFGVEGLPLDVKEFGLIVFDDCVVKYNSAKGQPGHFHRDVVIIEPRASIPGDLTPKGYVPARYFQDIQEIDKHGKIIASDNTTEHRIFVQPGNNRIVVPTEQGMYNHLGLPHETLPANKQPEAEKRYEKAGMSNIFLERCSVADKGIVIVGSFSDHLFGFFSIVLKDSPSTHDCGFGYFPLKKAYNYSSKESGLE